ncbi:MAG: hypothetical protein JWM45_4240 [Pseudonocardiales bacterium]|nr:hypothetical protein [Pseudonocardiales bacterium]
MDTQLESEEQERREGLGGRVRRFIDSELNRALDKKDRHTDEGHTVTSSAPTPGSEFDRPSATDREEGDSPGSTAHPVTTAPVDAPYSSSVDEPRSSVDEPRSSVDEPRRPSVDEARSSVDEPRSSVDEPRDHGFPAHDPSVDETAVGRAHDRSSAEAAADGSAERVGLLTDPAGLRDEWQRVQSTFVDDPQSAVHEASVLVDRTLQEIQRNVSRGQTGNPTSTEDLRVSFQRYREFFQRLLSA